MNQTINRNARCHCGSGKKFKNCHGAVASSAPSRKLPLGYIITGVIALAALFVAYQSFSGGSQQPGQAPPGKVWSVEHGHWHDAP